MDERVALRVAMLAEVPHGPRDAQQAAALSRLLLNDDASAAMDWSREGILGGLGEWEVQGAPVTTIVGLVPERKLSCAEGRDLYELSFTFLDAAPAQLDALIATARADIIETFGALCATRGVADLQARAEWAWTTGGTPWIALHGPNAARPRIWEILRHRRVPGGGFARFAWRDPLRPPAGTQGPSWSPARIPPPRAPPTYRIVADRLVLDDDRTCALLAGVVEGDDVRAALAALGAPSARYARHQWLRERGLREVEGQPAVLGLVLAQRGSYTTGAASVTRRKAERMLGLAKERLAALGIDREPDLVVCLA